MRVHFLVVLLALPLACEASNGTGLGAYDAAPDVGNDNSVCRIAQPPIDAACGDVPEAILRENCTGIICHHSGEGSPMGLDLLSPCVADRLVGRTSSCNGRLLVDPHAPEASFILEKLSSDAPECGGKSMPYGSHLPPAELACTRAWVLGIAAAANP